MTRFARGGTANQKKPHEGSSWSELKAAKNSQKPSGASGHDNEQRDKSASIDSKKREKFSSGKDKSQDTQFHKQVKQAMKLTDGKVGVEEKHQLMTAVTKLERSEKRRVKRETQREGAKLCFNCREPGHGIADCPNAKKDMDQGTGICFKCGSTEHAAKTCRAKGVPPGEFPYAKCFICGEMGHLSNQCQDNPRGLYPNGGCCKMCGSVEHFKKDCPDLQQQQGIADIKIGRLANHTSADAEVFHDMRRPMARPKKKVPKVVNF